MNHEYSDYEHLPTAEYLFHRAGEIAVLSGYINEVDNEYEHLRQFVVKDFSEPIKREWPELRNLTYTPAYKVEDSLSDDMVWITLSDDVVRRDFIISRNSANEYDIEAECSDANANAAHEMSDEHMDATYAAIDHIFKGTDLKNDDEADQVENIEFLLNNAFNQVHSATPSDIMMLGQLMHTLSMYPKSK
jgi:hypothetical protein